MSEARPRAGKLLQVLGVGFGVAVLVGNTIGSGILRTPGEVAGHLPSAGWFIGVWVAGGIYALLGSNALAEVATLVRESGGYTVFVRRGLGPYLGFVAGWSDWLSSCTSTTAAAIVVGESISALAGISSATIGPTACAVLFAFALVQWRGVRAASGTQGLTSVLKGVAFLVFIIICFKSTTQPRESAAAPSMPHGLSLLGAAVLALQAVIFTYDGWIGPAYFAGELRDPGRELPRSIFAGVLAVIAIYLLVNFALLHVLPMNRLAHDPFAGGTAISSIFGPRGGTILRVFVIVVLAGSINAILMECSRIFYALSLALRFERGTQVNAGGTPTMALLISTVATANFLISGAYNRIIAITAFLFVANYTFTFMSLFALRWREPDAPRPFRAWAHPWSTGLVLLTSLALLIGALVVDPRNSAASLVLLAISYPIFRILNPPGRAA